MPDGDLYDETAQAAIDAAYGIAGAAGAAATGCDHLVRGLRAGEGPAARALAGVLGGPPPLDPAGYAPLDADACRVLHAAASVRDRLGHPRITAAHLLAALQEEDGHAGRPLLAGLPRERVPEPPAGRPFRPGRVRPDRRTERTIAAAMGLAGGGDRAGAARGAAMLEEIARATPRDHPDRPRRLTLVSYAHMAAGADHLAQAVWHADLAVRAAPRDHPYRATALTQLATALVLQADEHDAAGGLPNAVAAARRAVALARERHGDRRDLPPDEDVLSVALSTLGQALWLWFQATGNRQAIDLAVAAAEEAAERIRPDHPKAGATLAGLAQALADRGRELTGDRDIRRAADLARLAVRVGAGAGDEAVLSAVLAAVLSDPVADGTVDAAAAAAAVTAAEAAVAATGPDDTRRTRRLTNLSRALCGQADVGGPAEALDRAVDVAREAVGHAGEDAGAHAALAAALLGRYDRWGEPSDADEALVHAALAVEHCPAGHADRLLYIGHAETAYAKVHRRTGDPKLLDIALAFNDLALEAAPAWHRVRAGTLAHRALRLRARYESAGEPDPSVLDEALDVAAKAVDESTDRPADRAGWLVNLASLLLDRYRATGRTSDLDLAVEAAEEAVAGVPDGDPRDIAALDHLSRALGERAAAATGAADDAVTALAHARTVVAATTAAATLRVGAAVRWGALATELGAHHDARTGYAAAVDLLPTLAWHGLYGDTRRDRLANWPGVGSDAAASALATGDPSLALALAERGRNIVWSQLLDARSELHELRDAHPELAERLAAVRAALDTE
ncbi:hypothetical protein [Actinomadura sp. WAC 06369]|uniref:hypothetical protein n=1 Tax=Actinomadura sp. WAC 06369 TaxID=2203193 RepID=UPI000F77CFBF|nr:hypothetical protein [Actinomadura sp. WAC 06369]RSN57625.1 hypothetical protein DMH08_24285 [Actinomadura sp. WAC 06369]